MTSIAARGIGSLRFPVLIGDIGGTNARFGLLADAHAELKMFPGVETKDFDRPAAAIEHTVLSRTALIPRSAVLAVAGPVHGDRVALTNCPWVLEPNSLIADLALEEVILLNDFEALALALPALEDNDLFPIGGGGRKPTGAKVVVGPGTGLGAAAIVHAAHLWVPIPGEGGHIEMGPATEEEMLLWPHIERLGGRVSAETVLSGPGLDRLYRAVCALAGEAPALSGPAAISSAALEARDAHAVTALDHFCRMLGRLAGDLALIFMAEGGVYIAGGIAPKIVPFLAGSAFREAFEAKAPHRALVAEMASLVITHPQPACAGIAAFARTPARFGVDLDGRLWRA